MPSPAFQLPPNTHSPAELEASNKKPVYIVVAVSLVLATGSVLLRCIARYILRAALWWDDYTIIIALLLHYGLDVSDILAAEKYGLGRHLQAVLPVVASFQKVSLANIVLWQATAGMTKASLLFLYYRLFHPSQRFRLAIRIGGVIIFCQWFSLTLVTIFQCRPVEAFWNRTIQGAQCVNLPRFSTTGGVLNLLTDVLILCLPMPMVWRLKTTIAQKITLTGMFLLGTFVCAISIIRISKLVNLNYSDPTWHWVAIFIWTTLENSIGIVSACLPTLRPLFGCHSLANSRSRPSNQKANRPSSQNLVKAQFDRLSEEAGLELELRSSRRGSDGACPESALATGEKRSSVAKVPVRPLHSINSTSRLEDPESLENSTRRADYE